MGLGDLKGRDSDGSRHRIDISAEGEGLGEGDCRGKVDNEVGAGVDCDLA